MNDSINITTTSTDDDKQWPVKTRKFQRNLKVKLSDRDKLERLERAAYLDGDITQREDEMSSAKKQAQARIEELQTELSRIMLEIRDGALFVDVACEERFIFRTGEVQEVRLDTGEILNTRPMTDRERQPELPLEPKEEPAKDEAADRGDEDDSEDDDGIVDDDYDPNEADVDEAPDTSILDAKAGDGARDTEVPPAPDLPTQKKKKGKKTSRKGGGK